MNQNEKENWAGIRRRGRLHFIFFRGLLFWGFIFVAFGYATDVIFEKLWFFWFHTPERDYDASYFIPKIIFGLLFGLTLGILFWNANEKAYKRFEDD